MCSNESFVVYIIILCPIVSNMVLYFVFCVLLCFYIFILCPIVSIVVLHLVFVFYCCFIYRFCFLLWFKIMIYPPAKIIKNNL